jgi:subtilisin family serine protease
MPTGKFGLAGLEAIARSEAEIIIEAFGEDRGKDDPGTEILVVHDPVNPEYRDDDVDPGGIAYMCARDHILAREEYEARIRTIAENIRVPITGDSQVVIDGIVLLTLNVDEDARENESTKGDPNDPDSGGEFTAGGGAAQSSGETSTDDRPPVVKLLEAIDDRLGVGIATPDHVLTASGEVSNCPATEPEEFYGPKDPYPPICCDDGGRGVRIFIADTGLLESVRNNEDFKWLEGVEGETDPRTKPGDPDDTILPYAGHGTFVAGVIRCMAPKATIYVANIFNRAGSALESHFVRRLNKAFGFGFEILHITASCLTRNNQQLITLEAWLKLLEPYKGVICIAPAGNNHTRRPSWPGAFPGVLSVGALATDWCTRAYFTNYGSWVDVYAPGQNLINAYATGTYKCKVHPYKGEERKFEGRAQWSGTSFSTPVVTGLIAARMARCGENAEEAAAALLAKARTRRIPGAGPVLLPGCDNEDGCRCDGPGTCDGDCRHGDCGHGDCGRRGDRRRCGGCGGCDRCDRGRDGEDGRGRDGRRPGRRW